MVELALTNEQKKEIVEKMKNEPLNTFISLQIKDETSGKMFVGAVKTVEGILVSGTRGDSNKSFIIQPGDITTLLSKGGRRRRVRKTQRRKSTKRRHTRRYRRK